MDRRRDLSAICAGLRRRSMLRLIIAAGPIACLSAPVAARRKCYAGVIKSHKGTRMVILK